MAKLTGTITNDIVNRVEKASREYASEPTRVWIIRMLEAARTEANVYCVHCQARIEPDISSRHGWIHSDAKAAICKMPTYATPR